MNTPLFSFYYRCGDFDKLSLTLLRQAQSDNDMNRKFNFSLWLRQALPDN